jgi:hypothetical protein
MKKENIATMPATTRRSLGLRSTAAAFCRRRLCPGRVPTSATTKFSNDTNQMWRSLPENASAPHLFFRVLD